MYLWNQPLKKPSINNFTDFIDQFLNYFDFWRDYFRNTNTKYVVQGILNLVLTRFDMESLMELKESSAIFESLLPYTERHYEHAKELDKASFILDYTLESMQL